MEEVRKARDTLRGPACLSWDCPYLGAASSQGSPCSWGPVAPHGQPIPSELLAPCPDPSGPCSALCRSLRWPKFPDDIVPGAPVTPAQPRMALGSPTLPCRAVAYPAPRPALWGLRGAGLPQQALFNLPQSSPLPILYVSKALQDCRLRCHASLFYRYNIFFITVK